MFSSLKDCLKRGAVLLSIAPLLYGFTIQDSFATSAQNEDSHIDNLYLDNLYPKYPPTKPASGLEAKMIKKGEYLAKIGDCIACHTDVQGGGKPFAGGLPIDTPFGRFYSPNITPDKETGIGTWTEQDFIDALHKGKHKGGYNLFPVFPYIYFAKTSLQDAKALYAYFMNIPAVDRKNDTQGFPFNMPGARLSLMGWNMLFFGKEERAQYKYDPSHSKEWNRGSYIVNGLGHCGMCHTPMSVFGAPKTEYFLTGGFIDGYWAPDISSEGLRSSSRLEVADVFKDNVLLNNAGPVAGPMAEVNHNSLSHLTESDRLAIATYLKTVTSDQRVGVTTGSNAKPSLQRGKQVYKKACVLCHQDGEMGAPKIGNGSGWYDRVKQQGLKALYRHAINGYNQMPLRGACVSCSDNDVISAVDYILNESLTDTQWTDLKKGKTSKVIDSGVDVYQENCAVCHAKGKLGAPMLGDKQVWKPIIEKNFDVLIENITQGKAHPKNGGCRHCSTREIIAALKYMMTKSAGDDSNYSLW